MEIAQECIIMDKGRIQISQEIMDRIGNKLKSTCMNDVWLLVTSLNDGRVSGEPLLFNKSGSSHILPENQLSALKLKQGDELKLVFSEELKFIIIQKMSK